MKMKAQSLLAILLLSLSVPGYAENDQQAREEKKPAQNYEFSEAEKRLWVHDHMANIKKPMVVKYDFSKTGTYEDGFDDTVTMEVKELHDDGTVTTDVEFFTGHRQQQLQPHQVEKITGNPVIGVYMQGDVYEMYRLTDGSWRYFQKRIKAALADNFTVEEVKIPYNGKQVTGKKFSIAPYVKDPKRAEFDEFADKTYEFVFSDEIPGELYQIKTVIPNNIEKNAPPLIKEVLTFSGDKPLNQKTAVKRN